MQTSSLIFPMFALIILTFIVMYSMLFFRVKAVKQRKISPRYFKLNKGEEIPAQIEAISQNYTNLFELPILFYTVCIVVMVSGVNSEYYIYHAWAFVFFRYVHSYIHTTYNHILHRLAAFALSGFVLLSTWIKLILDFI